MGHNNIKTKLEKKEVITRFFKSGFLALFLVFTYEIIILISISIFNLYSIFFFFLPFLPFSFLLNHINYYLFFFIVFFIYFILGGFIGIMFLYLKDKK